MQNSQSIKDKLKILARKRNTNFNTLLREYMYERFIERLSISKYNLNFILKGGYYLSILFGIENRSTMDIDACLKNCNLSKDNLFEIITEIINININDGAKFIIDGINSIMEDDEYSGYRVKLTVKIDNMKETFHFDVATGDPITPSEIIYKYTTLIENKTLNLLAYNLETVLAEKLETILTRGEINSRMKDYYDIYLIMTLKYNQINIEYLRNAISKTMRKRNFKGNVRELFLNIEESKLLNDKWISYTKRKGIKNISYQDTIKLISKIIEIFTLVLI